MTAPRVQLFVNTTDNISNEAATDVDTDKLLAYLDSNVDDFRIDPSHTLELYRFSSGYMNPPFLMKYGAHRYVLRRDACIPVADPALMGLKQGSTLQKTYAIMKAIGQNTNIPVPEMMIYCNDKSVIGCEFYIMHFVEGRIFYNTADTDTESHGAPLSQKDRNEMHNEIARVLSDIHCVDVVQCGLIEIFQKYNTMQLTMTPSVVFNTGWDKTLDFIKLKNGTKESKLVERYANELNFRLKVKQIENKNFGAQTLSAFPKEFGEVHPNIIKNDKQYQNAETVKTDDDIKKNEIQFLKQQILHNNLTLIHGDTQWENIIWHPTENKIIAVVDWEFCEIGNPCMEIAYNSIVWSVFVAVNFYHFKHVKQITTQMVDQELAKHIDNMECLYQAYARELKLKNRKLYDVYIKDDHCYSRNTGLYAGLLLWKLGCGFLGFHSVNNDELTEMGRAMSQKFPIGLGPFLFEVASRLMGINTMDNAPDSVNKSVYNHENKAARIVNELLTDLMEYELISTA